MIGPRISAHRFECLTEISQVEVVREASFTNVTETGLLSE